ncbi:Lactose operon repressor [Actinomyces bovis]|uniref:Lactose operon repressor n=1 Tax=Actinomyces bovis TaxID=1658 RepID=A0ABY1VL65_9ACTO|nr:LacI family DNA-binding transcriptional regulator [Actinomyces bovis]SPT52844.1 Lactose operon repressor [Actinomyces bovis]VEG54928.1 Lactose operon repressor [Actinomyces israelii]
MSSLQHSADERPTSRPNAPSALPSTQSPEQTRRASVPGRVRMVDVARRAGVSRALVSLVMRGKPGASPANRAKVFAAATELGYTPDLNARRLRAGTEGLVGVVFDGHDPFTAQVLETAHEAVVSRGHDLVLTMSSPMVPLARALRTLEDQRVSSVFLISSAPVDASAAALLTRMPAAFIGAYAPYMAENIASSVHTDDAAGMRSLVAHLAALGHQRIAVMRVAGRRSGEVRAKATLAAAAACKIDAVELEVGSYDGLAGVQAAHAFLKLPQRPTVLLAANDSCALAATHVLRSAGLRVPEEVSVTGFDDAGSGGSSTGEALGLTTVRQNVPALVEQGLELVSQVAGGRAPHRHVMLEPTLVIRSSTMAPAA